MYLPINRGKYLLARCFGLVSPQAVPFLDFGQTSKRTHITTSQYEVPPLEQAIELEDNSELHVDV